MHIKGPWKSAWKDSGKKGYKGIKRIVKVILLFKEEFEEWNFVA